ncbi:hypothetical protein A5641_19315 [Mycobacterium sp. 1554424.7]|nr:hypothetical protein A5641_19315 [Mycobacterium sp. 1554424.7]
MERWEVQYTVITSEPPKVDKQGPVRKAIEAMTTWVMERDRRSFDALVAEHLVGPEAAHTFALG